MQNLLQFLRTNFHFFLFLILQGISLFALVRFNTYHQSVFFSTASTVNGNILTSRKNVINYFLLKSENQKLKEENILLRTRGTENYIFITSDTGIVKDSNQVIQYSYIPAKVIYNNIRKEKNYFTMDRGSKHGVTKDMGVISPLVVAGIIVDVSENFSVAMSDSVSSVKILTTSAWSDCTGSCTNRWRMPTCSYCPGPCCCRCQSPN